MSVVTRNVIPERRGKGWPRCERGGDSDQKTWIKPPKETNMAVDALEEELKMEQESVYEQRLYCNRNVLQFLYYAVDFTAKKEL